MENLLKMSTVFSMRFIQMLIFQPTPSISKKRRNSQFRKLICIRIRVGERNKVRAGGWLDGSSELSHSNSHSSSEEARLKWGLRGRTRMPIRCPGITFSQIVFKNSVYGKKIWGNYYWSQANSTSAEFPSNRDDRYKKETTRSFIIGLSLGMEERERERWSLCRYHQLYNSYFPTNAFSITAPTPPPPN